MEMMVNSRLIKLEVNHRLRNIQSAYSKNKSTNDQLVYLPQEIENAFQGKKKVLAMVTDLTEAFDRI